MSKRTEQALAITAHVLTFWLSLNAANTYHTDRNTYHTDRNTYHTDRNTYHTDRNTYHTDRNTYHTDRNTYHTDRNTYHTDRNTYHTDRKLIVVVIDTSACVIIYRGYLLFQVNTKYISSSVLKSSE